MYIHVCRKMEGDHEVQLHSEEMYHQQLVKTLHMTIETLTMDQNKLKEKYRALKNKYVCFNNYDFNHNFYLI